MNIYEETFNFLKKIYPDVKQDCEVREIEGHYVPDYDILVNTPFDIRSMGGDDIYIDGYIFYDFRKVKKYINKVIKGKKNEKSKI